MDAARPPHADPLKAVSRLTLALAAVLSAAVLGLALFGVELIESDRDNAARHLTSAVDRKGHEAMIAANKKRLDDIEARLERLESRP